jgi:hypothetical protein
MVKAGGKHHDLDARIGQRQEFRAAGYAEALKLSGIHVQPDYPRPRRLERLQITRGWQGTASDVEDTIARSSEPPQKCRELRDVLAFRQGQ